LKRLLLDLDVALDALLDRPPFSEDSLNVWGAAFQRQIAVTLPSHGVTTAFYVISRQKGRAAAHKIVAGLLEITQIAGVDDGVLRRAVALGWPDFEDAVCAAAAEAAQCDLIVSRDPRGFPDSPVLVVNPVTAISMITGQPGLVSERPARGYAARPSSRRRGRPATARAGQRRTGTVQD